jgi:hypothetical protein
MQALGAQAVHLMGTPMSSNVHCMPLAPWTAPACRCLTPLLMPTHLHSYLTERVHAHLYVGQVNSSLQQYEGHMF